MRRQALVFKHEDVGMSRTRLKAALEIISRL